MKNLLILFITLTFLNCKSQNEFSGQFLSTIEVTAYDLNQNIVEFNIGYTVFFEKTENQNCLVKSKNELNSYIVEPAIRSVIRNTVRNLKETEIGLMDKENIKKEINKYQKQGDITLNSEEFVH